MNHPTSFNRGDYPTQAAALAAVRERLGTMPNPVLKTLHPADFTYLHSLLEQHPDAARKCPPGIYAFLVRPNQRSRKAWETVALADGIVEVFSWKICVTQRRNTPHRNLKRAMRSAIEPDITLFRIGEFSTVGQKRCAICPENVPVFKAHVDHETPFDGLVKGFLREHPEAPTEFDERPDGGKTFRAEDAVFMLAWIKYHRRWAKLRITCATCNLTRKRVAA